AFNLKGRKAMDEARALGFAAKTSGDAWVSSGYYPYLRKQPLSNRTQDESTRRHRVESYQFHRVPRPHSRSRCRKSFHCRSFIPWLSAHRTVSPPLALVAEPRSCAASPALPACLAGAVALREDTRPTALAGPRLARSQRSRSGSIRRRSSGIGVIS